MGNTFFFFVNIILYIFQSHQIDFLTQANITYLYIYFYTYSVADVGVENVTSKLSCVHFL